MEISDTIFFPRAVVFFPKSVFYLKTIFPGKYNFFIVVKKKEKKNRVIIRVNQLPRSSEMYLPIEI